VKGRFIKEFLGHNDCITSVGFNPDETMLISASKNGRLLVHRIHDKKLIKELKGHNGPIVSFEVVN